jgi:hypothetical protein
MEDSQKRDRSESAIRMPGALSIVDETLAPGESKIQVLQISPDYDFLLERITCRSDGPVLLKIDIAPPPEPSRAYPDLPKRSRWPWKPNTPATLRRSWARPWRIGCRRMRT